MRLRRDWHLLYEAAVCAFARGTVLTAPSSNARVITAEHSSHSQKNSIRPVGFLTVRWSSKFQVAPRGPLCWLFHAEQFAVVQVAE